MTDHASRTIQWDVWGNETTLLGGWMLLIGAIIGLIGGIIEKQFLFWLPMGIYGLLVGLIISFIEYPRGRKMKGHSVPRYAQVEISKLVDKLPLIKNYYHRVFIYFVVCIPACLIIPTILGAMCVFFGCAIYLVAARKGENWQPIKLISKKQSNNLNLPPSYPPPRLPKTVS